MLLFAAEFAVGTSRTSVGFLAAVRDFKNMDAKVRSALQDMCFDSSEDQKHHKIVFQRDHRCALTPPRSGSDHRGGLNIANDMSRLLS